MVSIDPEDELYRRLHPTHVNPDGSVNSGAFKVNGQYPTTLSVDIAKLTDPQTSVNRAKKAGFRLGCLLAADPMQMGFRVVHEPEQDNPSHAHLIGKNDKKTCRELARKCSVLEGVVSLSPTGNG